MTVSVERSKILHHSYSSIFFRNQKHRAVVTRCWRLHNSQFEPFLHLFFKVFPMRVWYRILFLENRFIGFGEDFMSEIVGLTQIVFGFAKHVVILQNELLIQFSFVLRHFQIELTEKFLLFLWWQWCRWFVWSILVSLDLFNDLLTIQWLYFFSLNVFQRSHFGTSRYVHVNRAAVLYHHCDLTCVVWHDPSWSSSEFWKVNTCYGSHAVEVGGRSVATRCWCCHSHWHLSEGWNDFCWQRFHCCLTKLWFFVFKHELFLSCLVHQAKSLD